MVLPLFRLRFKMMFLLQPYGRICPAEERGFFLSFCRCRQIDLRYLGGSVHVNCARRSPTVSHSRSIPNPIDASLRWQNLPPFPCARIVSVPGIDHARIGNLFGSESLPHLQIPQHKCQTHTVHTRDRGGATFPDT